MMLNSALKNSKNQMTTTMTKPDLFTQDLEGYQNYLSHYIEKLNGADPHLTAAIIYVLGMPSKRFRAKLVYACGAIYQLRGHILHPIALAIELIHAYSLVHDDLPAMDNDDWRRGQPSCHKAFDEATAILTGNALHHLAISHLLEQLPLHLGQEKTIQILSRIFFHIGIKGILSGQSLDLKLLKQNDLTLSTLSEIHHLKTTALLQAIVESIWIAGDGNHEEQLIFETFSCKLGLAYQMLDDYGDQYDTANWGKNQASDANNAKQTFVYFFSQNELKNQIITTLDQAKTCILSLPNHQKMQALVSSIEQRIQNI